MSIYLDLQKPFDKVPHKRLLWELRCVGGLRGAMLDWATNFLSRREMRTKIRSNRSSWVEVTSGVPQGSILAPIIFSIFVNDMADRVTSYMTMFVVCLLMMQK